MRGAKQMTKEIYSIAASYLKDTPEGLKEIITPLGTVLASGFCDAEQQGQKILIQEKGWDRSFVYNTVVLLSQKGNVEIK